MIRIRIPICTDAHLQLQGVEEEIADDLGLPAHEEGKSGGHKVPEDELILDKQLRTLGVLRRHRADRLAAVAHHSPPQ